MNQFAQLEQQYGLPEGLLTAVMNQESGGNPNAVSPKGAMGAFQFMPATAQQYGIDPNDPNQAAQGAAQMFGDLSKKYSGDVPSMLAGYNWGQGNVDRRGLNNAPPETQQYIQKIQNALPQYADAGNMATDAQVDPAKKVSDPALLAQLNGTSAGKKVTDPLILQQLNGNTSQNTSFLGEMGGNFQHGIQSIKDVLSGDYEDVGRSRPTPRTEALGEKLFPKGSEGTFMGAVRNVGNTAPSDWSGALLEKLGDTPEGKILTAIGGINPVYNAGGTAVNRYVNPAISNATGIAPENLQLLELAAPIAGIKKAGEISDPAVNLVKGAAGSVGEGISNRAKGAFSSMSPEDVAAQSDKNWAGSSASFKSSREAGAVLTPEAGNSVLQNATDAINSAGILNPKRHTDTIAALEDLQKDVKSGNLSLEKLDQHRQAFADAVKDNTTKMEGMNSDAYRALQAKNAIVDSISNFGNDQFSTGTPEAADSLLTGINQWAQAARFDRVAELIKKSEGDSTAIKRNFTNFVNKESNLKGFNPDEIAALKDAASRGALEKIERGIGTFGFDFGKVKNVALPAITSGTSAVVRGGAPLAVAGTVLRQTGKFAARGKAQTALDTIMSRSTSPAARPVPTAEVTPVKPTLALPAPERSMIVDEAGNSRLQTSQERDIAITERQRLQDIGLTPDVMNMQAKQNANRLMLKYGQSELGKLIAQNPNKQLASRLFDIPDTEYSQAQVNQMLRNGAWEKITASQKAQISAEVEKAWNDHQTPLAEMIMDADARAKELALAKGDSYKRTGFGDALNNALTAAPKKRSMGAK